MNQTSFFTVSENIQCTYARVNQPPLTCNVIDDHSYCRVSNVAGDETPETLLSSSVPQLQPHLRSHAHTHRSCFHMYYTQTVLMKGLISTHPGWDKPALACEQAATVLTKKWY